MGKINWGRVILGGLVAGVVINLVEYVSNTYVIATQNDAAMKALGVQLPHNAIPMFLLNGFLLGIAAIWLYAAARPRYGASAKTAAVTALGVWFIGYALPNFGMGASGIFPARLLCIASVIGLVEIILASIAGAAVYKEA
ncbi:MAG TPA: hypothetical protein VJO53_01175 [Candidatus Acidoferrales bacterium]|nr:hypothetical protein [Candidatus Acidoferrales bacterium]